MNKNLKNLKTDHLIPARRPDLVSINKNKKENLASSEFCSFSGRKRENGRNRNDKLILKFCQRNGKAVEHKGDGDANCSWHTGNSPKRLVELEIRVRIGTIKTTAL